MAEKFFADRSSGPNGTVECVLATDYDALAAELRHWKDCHGVTADQLATSQARVQMLEAILHRVRNEREVYADMRDDIDALLGLTAETAPNYNVPPYHLSKIVPGCRCQGCSALETKGDET